MGKEKARMEREKNGERGKKSPRARERKKGTTTTTTTSSRPRSPPPPRGPQKKKTGVYVSVKFAPRFHGGGGGSSFFAEEIQIFSPLFLSLFLHLSRSKKNCSLSFSSFQILLFVSAAVFLFSPFFLFRPGALGIFSIDGWKQVCLGGVRTLYSLLFAFLFQFAHRVTRS